MITAIILLAILVLAILSYVRQGRIIKLHAANMQLKDELIAAHEQTIEKHTKMICTLNGLVVNVYGPSYDILCPGNLDKLNAYAEHKGKL